MNDTEPTYLKRPILSADCLALAKIARLSGDKTITPIQLQWWIKQKRAQGILYEHEIDGVAHPIAWCGWHRNQLEGALLVDMIYCHLDYDAVLHHQMLLGHVMRLVSPKHPMVILEGVEATNDDLIQALHGLGFWNVASSVLSNQTWLEFRYGIGRAEI